ncbi:putative ankyrin repeat protein RF_0381 [Corticium candelabrum]|uniref:putative ankyrin repeat protein RF_0381 n=1 Tax=Corticium candelabrum TaxID=121492 RepID=UPI002E270DA0|nr:putative ankyrin repeat protein RF_0381 [Corticium candelabrum]
MRRRMSERDITTLNSQLVVAVGNNEGDEVDRLLSEGASPNACNEYGCPVLVEACDEGYHSVCKLLVKIGADVNKTTSLGWTALMLVARNGDDEMVDFLLSSNADAGQKTKYGSTAFDWAMDRRHMSTAGRLVLATLRVEDVTVESLPRMLHWAYKNKRDDVIKTIVKLGTEVKDDSGQTLLHYAAQYGSRDVVEFLLANKADADASDKYGVKPFDFAFKNGHMSIAGRLFSLMQSVEHLVLEDVWKLLEWACWNKEMDVVRKIAEKFCQSVEKESGRTLLHFAAQLGHRDAVNYLLKKKADADAKDKDGKRPYQLADGELRRRLRKAIDEQKYAVLFAEGTVRPEIIKLCFIGSEGAGKTTLMEALKRGWLEWIFTSENQADDPDCEEERTIGINVMTAYISGVGRVSLRDHAGQKQFHKTHGLFFSASNSFFILLVSLVRVKERRLCSDEELRDELQYWLSFLRSSLDGEFIPTVLIMASRGDYYRYSQRVLQHVVDYIRELFKGKINIIQECLVIDCRRSSSPEMRRLKRVLRGVKQQLQQVIIRLILLDLINVLANSDIYVTVCSTVSSSLSASCVQVASFSS